ncbi:MAG TPA: hypothetical protein VKD91_23280, partial [Pyrinomonadaceae bacterium]|nr:hypothetical protein [Pyrinomonadaceae bacterium]
MTRASTKIAVVVLVAIFVSSFGRLAWAQNPTDRAAADKKWPAENSSVVRTASEKSSTGTLPGEPVMRIALATGTGAATISTNAKLLSLSEFSSDAQTLETARVRVESRTLSAPRENQDRTYDIEIARAILRDDADRLVESLRELAAENARVEPDSDNKFKVLIAKQSKPDAEETKIKLEEAGFEVLALREVTASTQKSAIDTTSAAAPKSPVNSQTRLRFTSRPA